MIASIHHLNPVNRKLKSHISVILKKFQLTNVKLAIEIPIKKITHTASAAGEESLIKTGMIGGENDCTFSTQVLKLETIN